MADSRLAAIRHYFSDQRKELRQRWPLTKKASFLLLSFLIAWFLTQHAMTGVEGPTRNAFFLMIFAASLWITEAIPPFAVSILIIGFGMFFLGEEGSESLYSPDWKEYIGTWSSPIIWIMMGGFFLAMGAQITQFDIKFSKFVIQLFGQKPGNLLLGVMLVTGTLSMFMSNTATAAMMMTVLVPIIKKIPADEPFVKALFLGIASAGTLGGMGTVIGSPPNAIAVGNLENQGIHFGFDEWMFIGVPLAILFIFVAYFLLLNRYKTNLEIIPIETEDAPQSRRNTIYHRRVVVITFVLTIGLWLTSNLHHIPVAVVSFIPILIFTVSGVVQAPDLGKLPWDTLILVAGGLSLGIAITSTHLDTFLIGKIPVTDSPIPMLLILAAVTMVFSNVMSNTATASIMIPLGITLLPDQATAAALVVGFCASTALFLPISTPPNAIVFSSGYLRQSDFRYIGTIIGIGGVLLVVGIISIFYL